MSDKVKKEVLVDFRTTTAENKVNFGETKHA